MSSTFSITHNYSREVIEDVLDKVAAAPDQISSQIDPAEQKSTLNSLTPQILSTDDKQLIQLFHRAVRNHNALFPAEQTEPVRIYNKHFVPARFEIPQTTLTFEVKENEVLVTTELEMKRLSETKTLILDGKEQTVFSVSMNGRELENYIVTPNELIIPEIPDEAAFTVTIKSAIDPFNNKSMAGLYQSGDFLTSHCEPEGARRIFYTLDRPDVLSKYRVSILADQNRYPHCISNGNFVREGSLGHGLSIVTWDDPFPKPSYLFALVLGAFDVLEDDYEGIKLQIYVQPGKLDQARFAMWSLKKAMEFDETFFDCQYDLDVLKVVATPFFNISAMENKGLLIFNEAALLVDPTIGDDRKYRRIAQIVAHEYFHNWRGDRVTIRNFFEVADKEAFTDHCATLFSDWLWTEELTRVEQVKLLRQRQFPEDASAKAHPVRVDSFMHSADIFDATTYIKGREVCRVLYTILGAEGYREMQNVYFARYDGQAVTLDEKLAEAKNVSGQPLTEYVRWFDQPGTPKVTMYSRITDHSIEMTIEQSCPHPYTGEEQEPFHIPLYVELIGKESGKVLVKKHLVHFRERETTLSFDHLKERPVPVLLHGLSAPVNWDAHYDQNELMAIIQHVDDPFWKWEAAQELHLTGKGVLPFFRQSLKSTELSPTTKAHLLEVPGLRRFLDHTGDKDITRTIRLRWEYQNILAEALETELYELWESLKTEPYDPFSETFGDQMKVRKLKNTCLFYLTIANPEKYGEIVYRQYCEADNYDDRSHAMNLLLDMEGPYKAKALLDLYNKSKGETTQLEQWFTLQAGAGRCTTGTLEHLASTEGFDSYSPNHLKALYLTFVNNLGSYHDPEGRGYAFITDRILEIAQFNAQVGVGQIAEAAYRDYGRLSPEQQALMRAQFIRVKETPSIPDNLRDLVTRYLT